MYRPKYSNEEHWFPPAGAHYHRGIPAPNYRHHDHNFHQRPLYHRQQQWKSEPSLNYRRDRPPDRGPRPNFIIQLRSDAARTHKKLEIDRLCGLLKFQPHGRNFIGQDYVVANLFYQQWNEALEILVQLWEMRLCESVHNLTPQLIFNVKATSDEEELRDQLKGLFLKNLKGLMEGDLVKKWEGKLGKVLDEIKIVSDSLRNPNKFAVFSEFWDKRRGLEGERDLIEKRIEEFKRGLRSIINYLESGAKEHQGYMEVFRFSEGDIDWGKIYSLMMRECRRFDDGLPIYAYRQDILRQVHCRQISVLIGETGSGKSTQLVQFLADSGVCGSQSVICTQPRKLAAISLAERVKEESSGCYSNASVVSYSSYSSFQEFNSKVIFMTDHCLLQHYMNDKKLSKISCIIVDEAHERSLNTDLLLALIKNLLCQRPDLRLVIMSATANADQFVEYFFGCGTFHVSGRSFPVDIRYAPCDHEESPGSGAMPSYVLDVLRMVTHIHKHEKDGTILAFVTSQMEVELACERFQSSSAVALPLHGKLSYEDQRKVFLDYPGKRKIIFSTNMAETSLTIPGVKYVVDSGLVKESRFDSGTGMNILRVCGISQSSANQRAGRAGRTEPGTCYRLYSKNDFEAMPLYQEPEIRLVHLGVAVLRILALGIKNINDFDFVDAPSPKAIEMAIRNLIQLGAIEVEDDVYALTAEGRQLVKLGMEPRLGKIILRCFHDRLGREGLVLAAVMANASTIFCRVGTEEDKLRSDRLKVQFCHEDGDLFTLLAVYKEWETVPWARKNAWCWENRINAKSMRRCQDTVQELENCLRHELNIIIPSYWRWNPQVHSEHDVTLKNAILSSLAENVGMYSGYDQLGYEVAVSGKHVQLHPSCSLLNFAQRPTWIVFGEILSISREYLVCVTTIDFNSLSTLRPQPLFDFLKMDRKKLQKRVLGGFGSVQLKRFCGKYNSNLRHLVSYVRKLCMDERIGIEVHVDGNEILLYASAQDMEKAASVVSDPLEYEGTLLENECLEKCLYDGGPTVMPSVALFGAGGEIKHLELEKRTLTVDVFHSNLNAIDDKELLMFLEEFTSSHICTIHKFAGSNVDSEEKEKWGRVTFITPGAVEKAIQLSNYEFGGGLLKVCPSRNVYANDLKMSSLASIRAKIHWPQRPSKGVGIVKCDPKDVDFLVRDFSNLTVGGKIVWCEASIKFADSVVITGFDKELSEAEIFEVLSTTTSRKIRDFFLFRGNAVENPPLVLCEQELLREIFPFMPRRTPNGNSVRVQIFSPEPKDTYVRANIIFDGNLHLEAAKALEQIDGKVLPGCFSWQKIRCQHLFHSSVSCPASVYFVIRKQLDILLARIRRKKGVECTLERNQNGSYRVKISATATKVVAELRRPLEELMKGKIIQHADITPAVLQLLFSRDGIILMKSVQQETETFILFDKHNLSLRIFGPRSKIDVAQQRFVKSLFALHESKQMEIHLRGGDLPPDMMKRVVKNFGPDLHRLKEKFPEAEFSLNARRHSISIVGSKELKQKVETIIYDIAQTNGLENQRSDSNTACPICLCELEDSHRLEGCGHTFCRLCLVEQCESSIKSHDGFPLRCINGGCVRPILLTDLRTLLSSEKLEELFRASLSSFVAGSGGSFQFCPSPDCPSVYRVADPGTPGQLFVCGACSVETCTRCHLEYHPYVSCEKYKEFKDDPDSSLREWCKGKVNVKHCPVCRSTIEKAEGCNHVECRCGAHCCWVCLQFFPNSDECYSHLRAIHQDIY